MHPLSPLSPLPTLSPQTMPAGQPAETVSCLEAPTAAVQQIFSSVQGEGPYVGCRQIFVRFNGCHLRCRYCDTPAQPAQAPCLVETTPGSGCLESLPNPVAADTMLYWLSRLHRQARHHSVSLTGGEPLLHHRFLAQVLPTWRALLPIYLETSGTQPELLETVLGQVDMVAMDIKLPSTTGEAWFVEAQQAFLTRCRQAGVATFIKLVVNDQTTLEELTVVRQIVSTPGGGSIPIVLQPETALDGPLRVNLSPAHAMRLLGELEAHYDDVRLIPQTHKMVAIL
ncbi:MAG: 7-carboxy-7-deazaguanine synthase QueE [Cyanobacteria bacterium HKST-UBA04]|nr:7-carboxy-7-deazaguanine synthase QueE [Cyanobacteria bacterium HKST-UBA04]MCA9842097.1 7-carboxy-7-deazaguanine synthase QueE [Cyanobacteria bacterium HKST-UBA03]